MFVGAVLGFMLLLPVGSVVIEVATVDDHATLIELIGKWFVFWAVGARLATAGVRQMIRPGLTSEGLLGIPGKEAWQLVRELGFHNVALGLVGLISLWRPEWRLAVALAGGLFLLLAGLEHLPKPNRSGEENLAMWSDLAIGVVLGVYFIAEV